MIDQVADMLAQVRWDRSMVAEFLGRYLSEPKAHVFFDPRMPAHEKTICNRNCIRRLPAGRPDATAALRKRAVSQR